MEFPTQFEKILTRIDELNPKSYSATRNFIDGDISYLSPYISRGVISTKFIYNHLLDKGYSANTMLKFIQELTWRDYWQQLWRVKKEEIDRDLKCKQFPIVSHGIPYAVYKATTGIKAVDHAIRNFYETGYIHNHLRMYIASITCNIAKHHWKHPALWMYYHLLDGDWASNALSWQWICGTNSNKKYYANQDNINKFCKTAQKGSFLDISYDQLKKLEIPTSLIKSEILQLKTPLPMTSTLKIDKEITLIYNSYNLDPQWRSNLSANRILLLEPSHFNKYPISQKSINFILNLSKNIEKIQLYVGEFNELKSTYKLGSVYFKEHPLNDHYRGNQDNRDWMFSVEGYYSSFFAFWKKCKKEIIF